MYLSPCAQRPCARGPTVAVLKKLSGGSRLFFNAHTHLQNTQRHALSLSLSSPSLLFYSAAVKPASR